jgi:hypothetical protein
MKRRAIIAMLWILAVWPIGQRVLVSIYSVDPWELFGWGMYTRPQLDADVRVFGLPEDRVLILSPEERAAVRAFELDWRELGRLASPEGAAARIFALRPQLRAISVRATQLELDPKTDRIVAREDRWRVEREGRSEMNRCGK